MFTAADRAISFHFGLGLIMDDQTLNPPETAATLSGWVAWACDRNGVPELAARIDVVFNDRFTRRMGDAIWKPALGRGLVRLSRPLWPRATPEERRETVLHEVCHVVVGYRFGRVAPHGHQWQQAMAACGLVPKRLHRIDRTGLVRRQTRFTILACPKEATADRCSVGPQVRRRIARGQTYRCRGCGLALDRRTPFGDGG